MKLPNCKQKTIEYFLGITREDTYTGGELISVYHDYLTSHDYNLYHMLLLHNSDDMKGMLEILPILSYYDLFNNSIKARKVQANYYNDIHGIPRKELLMKLVFASPLPVTISTMAKGCHFKGEGHEGTLIIPIYEEELKYYYANFKDYYYLPTEDTAIHKSIASFVDKEYLKKRRRLRYLRRCLQSKGSHSSKRHLNKLSHKERNVSKNEVEKACNVLLRNTDASILVLEDLTKIRLRPPRQRRVSRG